MEQLRSKLPLCGCTGESKTWWLNRLYGARDASQRIIENNVCFFFSRVPFRGLSAETVLSVYHGSLQHVTYYFWKLTQC